MYKLYTLVLESYVNKRLREQKGQSRMDNPVTLTTFDTRHRMRTSKAKKKTSTL